MVVAVFVVVGVGGSVDVGGGALGCCASGGLGGGDTRGVCVAVDGVDVSLVYALIR